MLTLPELFPGYLEYAGCALILVGAQIVYAAVGFGAGIFAIALAALLLPDLRGAVVTLFLVNVAIEIVILGRIWRFGRVWLLAGLVPTTAIGLWLGTRLLGRLPVIDLKRALGVVISAAGIWFFVNDQVRARRAVALPADAQREPSLSARPAGRVVDFWLQLPVGLLSGTLMGLFGTGGPPVVAVLKKFRLDKASFRATLMWYFLIMGTVRAGSYIHAGLMTSAELKAALWLLPPSLLGARLGMAVHRRLSELQFETAVSTLLILLGAMLTFGSGR